MTESSVALQIADALRAGSADEVSMTDAGRLYVRTGAGETYLVTVQWAGGLRPDRDEAGDAFARAEHDMLAEQRAQ